MKTFDKIVLGVGAVGLALLLWRMDPAVVGGLVLQVGWGMLLILPQEVVAHLLNAWGWRLAFAPYDAGSFPLGELIRLRVAGDAVNYLTPSANIAGEFTRASLLNDSRGLEVRASSVLVAKCTQAVAQALFALAGLVAAAMSGLPLLGGKEAWIYGFAAAFCLLLGAAALHELWIARSSPLPPVPAAGAGLASAKGGFAALQTWLRRSFRERPGRFAASVACFAGGYAWGAFEAYWICRFLGLDVSVSTAMTIEVLSITIDGIFFMVPAKVGTQEGGKTAIFAALGLPATAGFAFGVVRHIRELAWAAGGLLLCSPSRPPQAPSATGRRSAALV